MKTLKEKLKEIKLNIGEELFSQLSHDDKILMANTAGVIDFGHLIDLDKLDYAL